MVIFAVNNLEESGNFIGTTTENRTASLLERTQEIAKSILPIVKTDFKEWLQDIPFKGPKFIKSDILCPRALLKSIEKSVGK